MDAAFIEAPGDGQAQIGGVFLEAKVIFVQEIGGAAAGHELGQGFFLRDALSGQVHQIGGGIGDIALFAECDMEVAVAVGLILLSVSDEVEYAGE